MVTEVASHLTMCDELELFVIDLLSFYDEKVIVTEVVTFNDDWVWSWI
jgi:hypothetical protein